MTNINPEGLCLVLKWIFFKELHLKGLRSYVLCHSFHIAGLKIIISENRWKGPGAWACEIMVKLRAGQIKAGERALSVCHTEALVQSEHTKNDDKKPIQSTHYAFVLPCALVNSGLGDKGLIPGGTCHAGWVPCLPCSLPVLHSSLVSLLHILQGILMLSFLCTFEISTLSWLYHIKVFS